MCTAKASSLFRDAFCFAFFPFADPGLKLSRGTLVIITAIGLPSLTNSNAQIGSTNKKTNPKASVNPFNHPTNGVVNSTLVPDKSELVDLLCFMITPNGVQLGGCFVSAIIITNNCDGNKTISIHMLREQLRLQRALIKIILKACAKACSNFSIPLGCTTRRIPACLQT